jgi:hypothetical protein
VNRNIVLAATGFVIGATIAVIWVQWEGSSLGPAQANATSPVEQDAGPIARPVERSDKWVSEPADGSSELVLSAPAPHPKTTRSTPTTEPAEDSPGADRAPSASHAAQVSEGSRSVTIQVNRVLVGGQLTANGILAESVLERYGKEKKYIVCFDLSVLAAQDQGEIRLTSTDFRLEDSLGTIYPPLEDMKQQQATLKGGESWRGGVAYAIHNDGAPARLYFRTRDEMYTPLPTSIFEPRTRRPE